MKLFLKRMLSGDLSASEYNNLCLVVLGLGIALLGLQMVLS
jgi:hypothetical protein